MKPKALKLLSDCGRLNVITNHDKILPNKQNTFFLYYLPLLKKTKKKKINKYDFGSIPFNNVIFVYRIKEYFVNDIPVINYENVKSTFDNNNKVITKYRSLELFTSCVSIRIYYN